MTASALRPRDGGARPGGGRIPRPLAGPAAPIVVAAVVAAVTATVGLTGRSLGFDEGATVAITSAHGHWLWYGIDRDGGNMSGYYLLLHVLIGAFGDSEWVLRLPSAVAAAATAGLVAAIGERLFGRRVAWVASILCAVTLSLVYWGQTARGYAPMLAFVCLAMLAYLQLVGAAGRADGRRAGWAALYCVAMALAAYCSFVAVLVIPGQLIAVAWRPRALRPLLAALVALAVAAIPLGILAVRRGTGQLFWVPKPNRQVEDAVLQSLTGSGLESSFHATFVLLGGWVVTVLALVALTCLVVRARRRARAEGAAQPTAPRSAGAVGDRDAEPLAGWAIAMVLGWVALPSVLTFVDALVSQPLFQPRNLLVSVPAIALAVAFGICHPRLPRWAAGAALLAALLIRVVPTAAAYDVSPEPWQQATAQVLAKARPGDCVTFYPEDARNAFRYYAGREGKLGDAPRAVLPDAPWSLARSYVELYGTLTPAQISALSTSCRRMWLVSSHEGQASGPPESVANLAHFNTLKRRLEHVFGKAPTTTDGYASAVHVELMPGRH